MLRKLLVLLVLGVSLPSLTFALTVQKLDINGFVSQGYLKSSDNNFLSESKDGTFQFNEAGLTVAAQVSDDLRIGAQLLARDLGEVGNNSISLDWAYGDYRYKDAFGVRLGKVKMPMGLYNESRDSDFMRPMIFLPQSIYKEGNRDLFVAYQGGSLYGNVPLGTIGDFEYQLFGGQVNVPEDSDMLREMFHVAEMHNMKVFGMMAANNNPVAFVDMDNDYVYGGSLVYNTPLDGLRIGASYFDLKSALTVIRDDGSVSEGEAHMKDRFVASIEYSNPHVTFASEYSEYKFEQFFFGQKVPTGTSQAWYVMLTYAITDQLSASVLYDEFYPDKDDKSGTKWVDGTIGMVMKDFEGWRKDLGIGLHYNVNRNFSLKAEYHNINGVFPSALLNNSLADLTEEWDYYAFKASFNF